MRVKYLPENWRPAKAFDEEIRTLFTLLHVIEPVDKLTLKIVKGDAIQIGPLTAWACWHKSTNTIYLPAYRPRHSSFPKEVFGAFVLSNLAHEYVHAIRYRDGRPDNNHRGFDSEIKRLYNRLTRET